MRAIRVHQTGGPEVLQIEEVALPEPGPGEVRVRVAAAGVNPVDAYLRAGAQGYNPALPYTPGQDVAGTVDRVGQGVDDLAAGDRVFSAGTRSGGYAEFAVCGREQLHPLPDKVSFAQGSAVGIPCGAAYRALFQRALARAGETVLVHGASGGVGLAAVQLALAAGLQVAGTSGDEEGARLIRDSGAHWVGDHDDPAHLHQLLEWTGGRGVDLVLEMLADVNLGHDLDVLAPGARVVVIGSRGTVEIEPRKLMVREASVLGLLLGGVSGAARGEIYAGLGAALAAGTLRPVVGRELPLDQAAEAHRLVLSWGGYGKIVLVP